MTDDLLERSTCGVEETRVDGELFLSLCLLACRFQGDVVTRRIVPVGDPRASAQMTGWVGVGLGADGGDSEEKGNHGSEGHWGTGADVVMGEMWLWQNGRDGRGDGNERVG